MNILKTTALASILALSSLSAANATYDGSDTLVITVTTSAALTVEFADSNDTLAFTSIVDGDQIATTQNVDITGDSTRSITCTLTGGLNQAGTDTDPADGDAVTFELTDDNLSTGDAITTISISMDSCTVATGHVLTITSTAFTGTTPSTTYNSGNIVLTASYVANTSISTYS